MASVLSLPMKSWALRSSRLALVPKVITRQPTSLSSRVQTAARAASEVQPSDEFDDGGPKSRALALGSVSLAVGLFLFTRIAGAAPDLSILAAESMPYDVAMADPRPTMVEFYADWCEVCKEMARDVRKVEGKFKEEVNFVMINVEDPRFIEELDEFGVDGIPHFVFLDKDKNEQGFVVGRMPRRILSENLTALARGDASIPHSQVVGTFSEPAQASTSTQTIQEASLEESSGVPLTSASSPLETPGGSPTEAPNDVAALAGAPLENSFYSFEVEDIKGQRVSLQQYQGRVSLVVNVASKCGLTDSNYKELTQLYAKYQDQGFEILAFPCNQFSGQEPGSNEQIENFACSRYKAKYPLFSKVDVNGPGAAPVYKFLKAQQGNGANISWNFEKFLVDKDGKVVERYSPSISPLAISDDIQALLNA